MCDPSSAITVRSANPSGHGSTVDAKALFGWTEPQLPPGWHGVHSTAEQPGTIVVTHDEAKPLYDDEEEEDAEAP